MNTTERSVIKDDLHLELTTKTFDVLEFLVENAGKVLTKDEILGAVWSGNFVEESNLPVHISKLRKSLGESNEWRFIETVQGTGYRFVAPVTYSQESEWHLAANGEGCDSARWIPVLAPSLNSIAVLPFEDRGSDSTNEYLIDGFTEGIINGLSHVPGLKVISRNTVFRYKDCRLDGVKHVGDALGVSKIITGRIRLFDKRISVSVELIQPEDDTQIWGCHFERPFDAIIDVQNEIVSAVSSRLISPRVATNGLARNTTENAESYRLFLMGRYLLQKRTLSDVSKAIEYFRKSLLHCPTNIYAHAEMVNGLHYLHVLDRLSRTEVLESIKPSLQKLTALDQSVDIVQLMYGRMKLNLDWKTDAAEYHVREALRLNPNFVDAHYAYAEIMALLDRPSCAIRHAHQILALDPISLLSLKQVGRIFYKVGEFSTSISFLNDAHEMEPGDFETSLLLGASYAELGEYQTSIKFLQQSFAGHPTIETLSMIGYVEALAGEMAGANHIIERMKKELTNHQGHAISLARVYTAMGEKDDAFEYLEIAFEQHAVELYALRADRRWKLLQADSRFENLVYRVGISQSLILSGPEMG